MHLAGIIHCFTAGGASRVTTGTGRSFAAALGSGGRKEANPAAGPSKEEIAGKLTALLQEIMGVSVGANEPFMEVKSNIQPDY